MTLERFDKSLPPVKLTLHPAMSESVVKVKIFHKVAEAIMDDMHEANHWPAYRWFYNLSDPSVHAACNNHYFPVGTHGGNRCPQKLYWEK